MKIFMSYRLLILMISISVISAKPLQLVTLEYPPYQYKERRELKGFVVAIVVEVFKRMDQPITIKKYPFARALDMVKTGRADALFTAFKNSEREKFFDYSTEILVDQNTSFL